MKNKQTSDKAWLAMRFNPEAWLKASKALLYELTKKHNCGWFDGGCYTLAVAINEVHPELPIYHISRTSIQRDHAVIRVEEDLYFDADGLYSTNNLFAKMKEFELTECTVLEEFKNIGKYPAYIDIKKKLQRLAAS